MRFERILLAGEAAFFLTQASLRLRLVPFRSLARQLGVIQAGGEDGTGSELPEPGEQDLARIRLIGFMVPRVARLLPWPALCLPQAMAAKAMLARRGIPSALHLGAMSSRDNQGIAAHAWLSSGSAIVTGAEVRPGHAELARFR